MASRTKQKEEARARRLAEERARAERAQRIRRMWVLAGVIIGAIMVVVIAVVVSTSSSVGGKPLKVGSSSSRTDVAAVSRLLAGIPESGKTLGSPNARVIITEYADLECPVCDGFALASNATTSDGTPGTGYLDRLISQYVRPGKVKLVYRSLETATGNGPNASMWGQQQAAAYAAGLQDRAWYYIELFYYEQQSETSSYVTPAFLREIAQQVPRLNVSTWAASRQRQSLQAQVASDGRAAAAHGFSYTPTIVVQGPRGEAPPIQSLPSSYSQLTSEISSVS